MKPQPNPKTSSLAVEDGVEKFLVETSNGTVEMTGVELREYRDNQKKALAEEEPDAPPSPGSR